MLGRDRGTVVAIKDVLDDGLHEGVENVAVFALLVENLI
jgi:hypothetical protein